MTVYMYFFFFFFFQAEDGIRDVAVTGVQTCALPISSSAVSASPARSPAASRAARQPSPDSFRSDRVVSGREVEHDHLELRHLVDSVRRALLAEPGLLEAAVGHPVGPPLGPPVDVEVARLDLARELPRPLEVLREDPRRQPVVRVVRERRSEEHTSELQSRLHLVCRLLLEKKNIKKV